MGKKVLIVIIAIAVIAGGAFSALSYHNKKLEDMRSAGISQLETAVNPEDYREAEKKQVQAVLDAALEQLETASRQEQVDEAVAAVSSRLEGIKTDAQLTAEEEAAREAAKEASIAGMEEAVDLSLYRDEQKKEVRSILDDAAAEIEAAGDQDAADQAAAQALEKIKEVKTDQQLSEEEEAAAKAAAEKAAAEEAARKKASQKSSGSSSRQNSNSKGCVGNDASNFY